MTLFKNIESKIKLAFYASVLLSLAASVSIIFCITYSYKMISKERDTLYVLDNGIPLLVNRSDVRSNRMIEYRAAVNTFHHLFFTLPPDDDYIEQNIAEAMYLVDSTGVLEYNNLKEKGYYNRILASSALLSLKTDSIDIDMKNGTFDYYGTQRIDRRSRMVKRSLHTSGSLMDSQRTINNPFGAIITNWRTESNKDIYERNNRNF